MINEMKIAILFDSFSIILWELATQSDPYPNFGGLALAMKVAQEGLRPEIPEYCHEVFLFILLFFYI